MNRIIQNFHPEYHRVEYKHSNFPNGFINSFLAFIFLISFTNFPNSQINQSWKWVHPKPQGNALRWVKMFSATSWYTVGDAGTFMSTTDGGLTWAYYTNAGGTMTGYGQGNNLFSAWFFNQNTGFVCGSNGWIGKTINGGINWDSLPSGTTKNLDGICFLNSNTGYISGGNPGNGAQGIVLKTTNGGAHWDSLNYSNSHLDAMGIFALDTNHVYVPLRVAINIGGGQLSALLVSSNGGVSWNTSVTGPYALNDVFFINADTGFICGFSGTVKVTTNGGVNWTGVNPGSSSVVYYRINYESPNTIYVCGDNLCYRTTNLGANWTTINPVDPVQNISTSWYSLGVFNNNLIASGGSGLLNYSTNNGANWTSTTSYSSTSAFFDVWCETGAGKVWVVGIPTVTVDQILYSSNGGVSWSPQVAGFQAYTHISMLNGSTGYICGSGGEVRKTTNSGTNWNLLTTPIPSNQILYSVNFIDVNTGWVFSNSSNSGGNIWKTSDGGNNWIQQNSGLTGSSQAVNAAFMVDANTGWFANNAPSLPYKTTNGGVNWAADSLKGGFNGYLNCIKMINNTTGYACGGSALGQPAKLFRTTNGGNTAWDTIPVPFYNIPFNSTDWLDINNGVLAASTGLTARTTNGGASWNIYMSSVNDIVKIQMRAFDTMYAVCLFSGSSFTPTILKWQQGLTGVTKWENSVPKDFSLSQNYPNPFNPVTTIKFGLPGAAHVSLLVYDITGRLVETLLNNVPLNAGTITQQFNGSNFASGVYFYSLIVDNIRLDTRKMILLK